MSIKTIAFLYPGAMGASLARTLSERQPHLTLLTSIHDRSTSTKERAKASGLQDTTLENLVTRSDIIISILPPSAALTLATDITAMLPNINRSNTPIYVDANAVSPGSMKELDDILRPHGVPLIDGCVIGLPAKEGYDPKIYLSSAPEYHQQLTSVADVLSGKGHAGGGLKVDVLDDAGEGAASALKMCYGGINKGATGLATLMILAAHSHSPQTADALLQELGESALAKLDGFSRSIPDMVPKAYRWVGEMEEIGSFIQASLAHGGKEDAEKAALTYRGLADVFQRIADDLKLKDGTQDGNTDQKRDNGRSEEVGALLDWAEKGKKSVAAKKSQ